MLRLPKLITKTLSVRLSLIVVSAMSILLVASMIIMLHYSRKAVKDEALNKAAQTLEGTVQRIDNIMLSIEQSTGNIYFSLMQHLDEPEMMFTYCRELVLANPYISGCAIALEPHFYKDREYFMAYVYRTGKGLSYSDSPIIQAETFGDKPYTEQIWYTLPMETKIPKWVNPLKDINADVEPIITFSIPLYGADGIPVGVIGVDLSLNQLSKIILAVKPSPNSYCTLLAEDGSFIVHPDSDKLIHQTVFTQLSKGADPTVKKAADAMVSGETGYMPFRMNGADYYVFYKPFSRNAVRGRAIDKLEWSAGIIYPKDDIFGDYNRLLYYVIGIAIIGLLLLLALSQVIIHRQLKPLVMLSESAQSIANGNYSDIIPDSKQDDEIGRLQDNFQHMQQSLSVHIRDLEQMTATLKERGEVLRKEYERTQKADKMKNTFLHNMTNQMAEPANAISNDVETLCNANMHMDRQQAESLTSNILHQGKVITELLNNLLNMSQDK